MSSCGVAASADGVGHSGLVLYVNGEYRDDSDIGKLMHDFNCTSADDMNFEILAEKPRYEQGLTIEQIARAIGFSMETVEKWLTQKAG